MTEKHQCIMGEKFIDMEWKTKGNYELTKLAMENTDKNIADLKKDNWERFDKLEATINSFITSAENKFIKKETVQLVFIVIWVIVTAVWVIISFLKFVVPVIIKI